MTRAVKLRRRQSTADRDATLYRVQLFRPLGGYPNGTTSLPTALFHADSEIAFSVILGPSRDRADDLPYSEVDWLNPETIRLMGSLILAEKWSDYHPRCRFYPLPYATFVLNENALDLTLLNTAQRVKAALQNTIDNRLWPNYVQDNWKKCVGEEFSAFDQSELDFGQVPKYWSLISTSDYILIRAIHALVKADMLIRHQEFVEEATIATFIALDASFMLVTRHLRAQGIVSPTAGDAGKWLNKTFDQPLGASVPQGMKYFEEFYEQRVQTLHPASRFGDRPYAPISYDDYIHLRKALPGILAYLLTGEHSPSFVHEVGRRNGRRC